MRTALLVLVLGLTGCTLIGGYFDYDVSEAADLGDGDLGPVQPGVSVEVEPASVPNDGLRTGEVTVTVRDESLAPLAGLIVTLSSSRQEDQITRLSPLAATGRRGIVRFAVASSHSGTATLSAAATVAGEVMRGSATIRFVPSLSLVAGQMGGTGWADGLGEAARLQPTALVWDGQDILVADSYHGLIRRIDVTTSGVSTVLGDPLFGPLGRLNVDGPADSARFAAVSDLAVEGDLVYIADHVSCTIRKFDRGLMQVSIVAGTGCAQTSSPTTDGTGAMASFHAPRGLVAVDASTLYVADGDQVRKLSLSGGNVTVSTLGPGSAGVSMSIGDVVNIGTDAYVTDAVVPRIAKITSDGTISDVLVTPQAAIGLTTDGTRLFYSFGSEIHAVLPDGSSPTTLTDKLPGARALGYNPVLKRLYATIRDEAVVAVDPTTGTISKLAGLPAAELHFADGRGADARLYSALGITADPNGNLYVADRGNCRIRKVVPATGEVTTLAGSGTCIVTNANGAAAGFMNPFGIAYTATPSPALWVSEAAPACVIRRIDLLTLEVSTALGKANTCVASIDPKSGSPFLSPARMVSDGLGLLFIADGSTLWRVNVTQPSPLDRLAVATFAPDSIAGLAVSATHVYIAAAGSQLVWRLDRVAGGLIPYAGEAQQAGFSDGPALGAARFGNPYALAMGPSDQSLLVAEYRNNLLRQVDLVAANHPVTTLDGSLRHGAVSFDPVPSFNFVIDMVRVGGDYFLLDANENVVLRYRP